MGEQTEVPLRDLTADEDALVKSVDVPQTPSAGLKDVLGLPITSIATFTAAIVPASECQVRLAFRVVSFP